MNNRQLLVPKLVLVFLFIFNLNSIDINAQSKNDKTVVGKVGKEKVTYGELKDNFNTGIVRDEVSLEELEEFLPVYLDYKAKVLEANKLGYFENAKVMEEYNQYALQAAYAFWLEEEIKPTRFENYYKRSSIEVEAQHILISVEQTAGPQDTLNAYNSLIEARDKALAGEDFLSLIEEYSSKRNDRTMGGPLPWFSVGVTVSEFEDVVFDLEVNQISMPFRTQFGYHIVKLTGKRPTTPARDAAHIYRRRLPSDTTGAQLAKLEQAFEELKSGRDWNEVTKEYSEDNLSANRGGKLGWMSYSSRYNQSFVAQIMNLDPTIDFTAPIETVYGYHIFKIDSIESYSSEEQRKKLLLKKFESSPLAAKTNSTVWNWVRDLSDEEIYGPALASYEGYMKSLDTLAVPNVVLPENLQTEPIYRFESKTFTLSDFHEFVKDKRGQYIAKGYSETWFNAFVGDVVEDELVEATVSRFDKFKSQLDKYREGLAVYQINDDNVWSSATVDTSALINLFESKPEDFSLAERDYYHLIRVSKDSSLTPITDFINEGNSPDSIRTYFRYAAVNVDSNNTFTGEPFNLLDDMEAGTFSGEFEYKNRKSVFYLNAKLPARKMTFEEAFGRLLAAYQPEREQMWLKSLRKTYKTKADFKKLRKAYNQDKSL